MTNPASFDQRVTVVIPLYNKAAHVERTLRSVLAQTLPAAEIFVVDDGSTDGGPKVARDIAMEHPSVRVITVNNRGPAAARNVGLENATGEFVTFLDADDEWKPEFLRIALSKFEQPGSPVDAVWTGYVISSDNEDTTFSRPSLAGVHEIRPDTDPDFVKELVAATSTCGAVLRTSVAVERGGFYDATRSHLGEDKYFFMNVMFNGKFAIAAEVLAIYHTGASELTSPDQPNMLTMEPYFTDPESLANLVPVALRPLLYRQLAGLALIKADMYARSGRREAAVDLTRRFAGHYPYMSRLALQVRLFSLLSPVLPTAKRFRQQLQTRRIRSH